MKLFSGFRVNQGLRHKKGKHKNQLLDGERKKEAGGSMGGEAGRREGERKKEESRKEDRTKKKNEVKEEEEKGK